MRNCSVVDELVIEKADRADYDRLERFHYRSEKLPAYAAAFALKPRRRLRTFVKTAGIIVYTMPAPAVELRNVALGQMLRGLSTTDRLKIINANIRCIGRVIIEPRFRGLGLASLLVSKTLKNSGAAVVEAMAIMGRVNPFFERAGMQAYHGPTPARVERMKAVLSVAGVEQDDYVDPEAVHAIIDRQDKSIHNFIDYEMRYFLQSYGRRRRSMHADAERTRYVLSKLTDRPIYYVWFNPQRKIQI